MSSVQMTVNANCNLLWITPRW